MPNMFKEGDFENDEKNLRFKDSFDKIQVKSAFLIQFKISCVLSNDLQFIKSFDGIDFFSCEQKLNNDDSF